MSLIYLKNKDNSVVAGRHNGLLPYRWSNYFTKPIVIKPYSQIAYVSSSFNLNPSAIIEGDPILMVVGNPVLNPTIPIYMNPTEMETTIGVNKIGELCNNYGCDGNYNHIFTNFATQYYPLAAPYLLQQEQYQTGFNFMKKPDNKCDIRITQRSVNDVFLQGFNCNGLNASLAYTNGTTYAAGLGVGTGDNVSIFNDLDFHSMSAPTVDKVFFGWAAASLQPKVNTNNEARTNTSNFYNTGWASQTNSDAGSHGNNNLPQNWTLTSATNNRHNFFNTGSYGCICSNTGIKQNISMSAAPTDNLGGHASISASNISSGGYGLMAFSTIPQGQANTHYSVGYVNTGAADVGFCGIPQQSFGVHSIDYINNGNGNTPAQSRAAFTKGMDLNKGATGNTQDLALADGAKARFIFGVDMTEKQEDLIAEVKYLNPQSGTMDVSRYASPTSGGSNDDWTGGLSIKSLSNGINTAVKGVGYNFGGKYNINCSGATNTPAQLVFRFRWTSPYTMCCEFMLALAASGYDLETDTPYLPIAAPANQDPTAGWCMLYDMKQDPATFTSTYIPSFMGDIGMVGFPPNVYRCRQFMKGYFDVRQSSQAEQRILSNVEGANSFTGLFETPFFAPQAIQNTSLYQKNDGIVFPSVPSSMATTVPEEFSIDGISQKKISFVLNEMSEITFQEDFLNIAGQTLAPLYSPSQLRLGQLTGITADGAEEMNIDIEGIGTPYIDMGFNGLHEISGLNSIFCNHIQISNLPIQSQQGVKSTLNKTIYIVNSLNIASNTPSGGNNYKYGDLAPYLIWIDINNAQEMTMNKLNVLITDDDNNEQRKLRDDSDVVVMIRQKPTGNINTQ